MFDQPPLHPQSVGDIIGRGFKVFRNNIPACLKAQLGPAIILTCGHILLQFSISYALRDFRDMRGMKLDAHVLQHVVQALPGAAAGWLISVVAFWLLMVKQLAFINMAAGGEADFSRAIKFAADKKFTLLGVIMLFYIFFLATLVAWGIEIGLSAVVSAKLPLLGIPGIVIGVIGVIVSSCVLSFYYMLMIAAIAQDPEPASTLIARAFTLMMRDIARVCGFGLLMTLIIVTISYSLTLPVLLMTSIEAFKQGMEAASSKSMMPATMPLHMMVISQLWQTGVNLVLLPILFVSNGLLYRDLKIRQEGLDLLQSVNSLKAAAVE